MKKWIVFGLCALSLLLAGAVKITDQLLIEPRIVSDWGGIYETYLRERSTLPPLPFSVADTVKQIEADDWSFLADGWQVRYPASTLYLDSKSKLAGKLKLPLRLLVYEDLQRGEIVILSSGDGEEYKGEALFDAPEVMPALTAEEEHEFWFRELSPRRIIMDIKLVSEKQAWSSLLKAERTLSAPVPMMMAMSFPPSEHTNDLWLGIDGTTLTVFVPEGFTNRVELYKTTSLVSNIWTIVTQNLTPVSTNPSSWSAGGGIKGYFSAGNMDVDTDFDELPNARERFVHKTDPEKWDTDGDWLSDGWEVTNSLNPLVSDDELDADSDGVSNGTEYRWGTDPFDADSDDDGLNDGVEIAAGTDPHKADTDGDGLSDAWEVRYGYDAVNTPGALSGTDQVGRFDAAGSALAVEVRGDIAYVADGTNGLVIIDVRHPGGVELGSLELGGEANDLLLTNNTLWVALGEEGVAAVDVSDPFRPHKLGSYYTGGYTRGLALESNRLYLANTTKDLLILDVEYLEEIVQLGQYEATLLEGRDVCVNGNTVWLALEDRVHQVNVSNVSSPTQIANAGEPNYEIQEMVRVGGALYLAGGPDFNIWNSTLGQQDRIGTIDTEYSAYGMGIESNRVLLAEGLNFVELIDVSNEASPAMITNAIISGFANDAALIGDRGYIAAGAGGLAVIRFSTDDDADGMDDDWEILYFGSTQALATNDFDSDGIFNCEEYLCGMNPTNSDSDADGLSDYAEIWTHNSDPTRADGDLDGLSDDAEINTYGTQAGKADTDGDGMVDGWEVEHGFDPLVADGTGDGDSDGLSNAAEYWNHTDPSASDSDGDSLSDAWEVFHGTANQSTNVALRNSFEQVSVRNTDGEARGVCEDNGWLYVADGTSGLVIFDLSIPSAPVLAATLDTAGFAYDLTVDSGYAYVADGDNGLVIIAVTNPSSPSVAGHYNTAGTARTVYYKSPYVYVADEGHGMPIINVSNPVSPWKKGRYIYDVHDVVVEGNAAYIVDGGSRVDRLNVSNPSSPSFLGGSGWPGLVMKTVEVKSGYTYAVSSSELHVFTPPLTYNSQIFSYNINGAGRECVIEGDRIYIVCEGALSIWDISSPTVPVMKHTHAMDDAWDIFPNGEYVYVADGSNGIAVFRFMEDSDEDGMSDFWEEDYFGDLSQNATNDFDGDGISNWGEYLIAGNPAASDADGDLLSDYDEIWTHYTQPLMADTDLDDRNDYAEVNGTGGIAAADPLDPDSDDDDLNDGAEVSYGADPHDTDTDDDEMPDGWEVANGLSPTVSNASSDFDSDGLLNFAEYQAGTKANDDDTDNDGLEDGDEITAGTDPLDADSDDDGLSDGAEVNTHSTNPLNPHSDSDAMPDGWEVDNGLNPGLDDASGDLDGDGLTNAEEYQYGTLANNTDSDGDGIDDEDEVRYGFDPADDDSDGDGFNDDIDVNPLEYEIYVPFSATNELPKFEWGANNGWEILTTTLVYTAASPVPLNAEVIITNVMIEGVLTQHWSRAYGEMFFEINEEAFCYTPLEDKLWENNEPFTNDITVLLETEIATQSNLTFDIEIKADEVEGVPPGITPMSVSFDDLTMTGTCTIAYLDPAPAALIPDYDRNGIIDTNDLARLREFEFFRFWVNDDDDSGYDGGSDIPGVGHLNHKDTRVNGVRDLIDFFPVFLSISNLIEKASPDDDYHYYLCHDGNSLRAVQTVLPPNQTGDYLRDTSIATGLKNGISHQLSQNGWGLPEYFLEAIRDNGQGVVLIEALEPTDEPLRLEVRLKRGQPKNLAIHSWCSPLSDARCIHA